jgi:hypothetical protein
MKHVLSSAEEDDVAYFGDCEKAGAMDDMVGLLAVLCVECRLCSDADWCQLFLLRTVSKWWARVINASLVAEHVRELDLLDTKARNCLNWCEASSFPSLQTLSIDSVHPLCNRVPQMTTLRSLIIDGWIPEVKNMVNLERLAVIDMYDRFSDNYELTVSPPCNLKTLVLMDQFLAYKLYNIPSQLPHLRRLVLTTGSNAFERDPHGDQICTLLPQLEEFRWYVTFFEPYRRTLGDFRSGKL